MKIRDLSLPEGQGESKIDNIVTNLYKRVAEETEKLLRQQLATIGIDVEDVDDISENCIKIDYPGDMKKICSYFYKDRFILGVNASDSMMAIEFNIPKLETQIILKNQISQTREEMIKQGISPDQIEHKQYGKGEA